MNARLGIFLGALLAVAAAGPALAQTPEGAGGVDLPVTIDIELVPESGTVDPAADISPREGDLKDEGQVNVLVPHAETEAGDHERAKELDRAGETEHGSGIDVERGPESPDVHVDTPESTVDSPDVHIETPDTGEPH